MQTRIKHIPDVGVVEVFEKKSDILWSMATERGLPGPPIKGDAVKFPKNSGNMFRQNFQILPQYSI
jgi:hypothetical protein